MELDLRAHRVSEYNWEAIIKLICHKSQIPGALVCQEREREDLL
jgi:hypothetical protein